MTIRMISVTSFHPGLDVVKARKGGRGAVRGAAASLVAFAMLGCVALSTGCKPKENVANGPEPVVTPANPTPPKPTEAQKVDKKQFSIFNLSDHRPADPNDKVSKWLTTIASFQEADKDSFWPATIVVVKEGAKTDTEQNLTLALEKDVQVETRAVRHGPKTIVEITVIGSAGKTQMSLGLAGPGGTAVPFSDLSAVKAAFSSPESADQIVVVGSSVESSGDSAGHSSPQRFLDALWPLGNKPKVTLTPSSTDGIDSFKVQIIGLAYDIKLTKEKEGDRFVIADFAQVK